MIQDRTNYREVREQIEDGDVLAFAGRSWISFNAGGPIYHVGMARWDCDALKIVQARALHYAGERFLSEEVRSCPGRIHVLRPKCHAIIRRKAAAVAFEEVQDSIDYGYWGVARASLLHAPLLHWLLGRNIDPDAPGLSPENSPKFCSQLVEWSYRKAGAPLVSPRLNDAFVDPVQLWNSALLDLKFPGLTIGVAA